jgi:amino acid adenylation domain-containing protein
MKTNKRVADEVVNTPYVYKNSHNTSGEIDLALENNLTNYWKERLKGVEPLNLFTDQPRSDVKGTNKASIDFFIDEKSGKQLNSFSEQHNVTLFVTLLTAYKVLLYRYSNQEDICVGNAVLNNEETEYFLNALALRTELNGNDYFEELLQRVNTTVNEAYKHKRLPFEKIVSLVGNDSDLHINPLYQVMFHLEDGSALPDVTHYTSKSDLAFIMKETGSGLHGMVEYNTGLYTEDTIFRIIDHYKLLLGDIIINPKKSIGSFPILTKAEEHKLLVEFNTTAIYPKGKTVIDFFEEQVAQNPGKTAVVFGEKEISYHDLNEKSNQLAHYLKTTYSIKADDLVGLTLDRSEWMVIAILGVLKSGAAYVPVDPAYPEERIAYILDDSKCKVLIDKKELDKFKEQEHNYSKGNLSSDSNVSDLAYVIYTSGSTGNPKGVMVEHGNLAQFTHNLTNTFGFRTGMRLAALTTYTFDISVLELLCSISTGICVFVMDEIDPLNILSQLREHNINILQVTPSRLNQLSLASLGFELLSGLDILLIGGEPLPEKMYQDLRKELPGVSIYNVYGPTEATIWSTCSSVNDSTKLNIGKPLIEEYIYILNAHGQLLPVGIAGELYIGGTGVTRGYLNRLELTNEKFVPNPFRLGERMYNTGDIGRWLPDGNIQCLGRVDDQVKIRGFRIELGEIASVLQKHDKVKDSVVVASAVNGPDKELIAYTTGEADAAELRDYLKEHLPIYMVPGYYVHMESIPLTSNGKVNKKALPLPAERYHQKQETIMSADTETQKAIAGIWQNMLDIELIGIDDNFFDLGGSSIMAPKVINQINKETGIKLSLSSLYQLPTIRELAHKIETNTTQEISPVMLLKEGEGTPVFIFPPWSSYPTIFDEFVNHFKGKNPLYGILYTEDTENFPFQNVQEYVKYLITHIKKLHPTGSYGLIGYSLGARTILEVAIQLQQAKNEVELLGVISHFPASPSRKGLLSNRKILDEIRIFRNISSSLRLKYIVHRLPHFLSLIIKGKHDISEIQVENDAQTKIFAMHETYETAFKYKGDMVLIYETSPDADPSEYKRSQVYRNSIFKKLWSQYIDGNIHVRIVECKHIDFFKEPAVGEVTDIVESFLK